MSNVEKNKLISINEEEKLIYHKLTSNAFDLVKYSVESAGFDLSSAYDYEIPPNGKVLVFTDIQILVPKGCYGRIAPRSGLAIDKFIQIGGLINI
jgi:dUTP pyrophosphatase